MTITANIETLSDTARALVAPGKGILAADESTRTIKRRFDSIGVESTETNRRDYREMLFRTAGASEFISGVILYDETIRQHSDDGTSLVKVLTNAGMMPGIKVDTGAKDLAGSPGETVTDGLDGLRERLAEYVDLGARFTKWRATIAIGDHIPTHYCLDVNAHALARFAALSQEAGLVPMVEPEVLMDGDHSIDRCYDATEAALVELFRQLREQRVELDGILLKTNMVLSGASAADRAGPEEVARQTVACLKSAVPASMPGIVFLSGGQADDEATTNLNAINRHAQQVGAPWELSFSYGRGLQGAPLQTWAGNNANREAVQQVFHHRAMVTAAARQGRYDVSMEAG